ncbi:MAG: ABC transporter permease [Thermoanaerobaculales bacterium]|jgi:phospholipid/cholesterol/gamma-HCH transport system permease protein|nr:ABC transporter permease [Thermoanaerobaculales bacterium]
MIEIVGRLGRWTLRQIAAALAVSVLMVDTMVWLAVAPLRGRGFRWRSAVEHFVEFGVRSLPIVGMICFLVGVIIALQASYTLGQWGANRYIADLVAVSALRELAPLMTAVLVAGRCGSAITAEIGTMKVNEELDALEVMGLNPIKYLVAPKFLAMVTSVPSVTIIAMLIMILGGWTASVFVVGVETEIYLRQTVNAIIEKDLVIGLVKSFFFGVVICWVGVYRGFQVEGGAEGVGRLTTASVVTSIFLIVIVDLIFTVLFYYL